MKIKDHKIEDIAFLKSPNFNERPDPNNISLIVIHSISLPSRNYNNDNVESFFLNNLDISTNEYFKEISDLKVSSHLYIKRSGQIIQFVPFDKRAWHAGISNYKGKEDCNDFSIGIELEGCDDDTYEEEQYKSLVQVTKALIEEYDLISKKRITGHSDIAPERKTDPGKYFEWNRYLDNV